jgi:predicted amidohydrolase
MVCYDVEFPEWVRLAMLGNASILALPTNWPKSGPLIEPTPLSAVIVQAAAAQNRMIIAAADRTGLERGISWVGSSVIADSDGAIRALADQNKIDQLQILLADVDVPTDRRIGPRNNVRADRKPELYGKVLEK